MTTIKNTIKEHNLSPENSELCHYIEHNPVWDGNYYTCRVCGKEFVMKSSYTKYLLQSVYKTVIHSESLSDAKLKLEDIIKEIKCE